MQFINLKDQYETYKLQIDQNIQEVITENNFIMGRQVSEFEEKLAHFVGVKHCISCSDGTAALQLIYMAYGIGKGDAVFCPDMTFIASVEPACMLGATPVFCDIDKISSNIDCGSLERQIKYVVKEGRFRPRAIVAVDFVGNPADYDKLREIADKYGLLLIEDAAQGMGAEYKGRKCGSLGDIAATSFFPSKPLGCYGDGGAVFTNDDSIAELLKSLRVHGKGATKYDNQRIGINSRLDTLQAAIMLPKLDFLQNEINMRQEIAQRYTEALNGLFIIPMVTQDAISSYAQYVLLAQDENQRDTIVGQLKERDIPSLIYYPNPLHIMKAFQGQIIGKESFSNTIDYALRSFAIPFSPYLRKDDQKRVIEELISIIG